MAQAEESPYQSSSNWGRRVLRWSLGLLLLLGIVYWATVATLSLLIDAEYVEQRVDTPLDASTAGLYDFDVQAVTVDWRLWRRALRAEGIRLRPDSSAAEGEGAEARSSSRYYAHVSTIRLQGIHLWDLLWHGEPELEEVVVHNPRLRVVRPAAPAPKKETRDTSVATAQARLADRLPGMNVHRFVVREGNLSLHRGPDRSFPADTLWGLSARLNGLATDSAAVRDTSRVLLSNSIRASFDGYRHLSADSLYAGTVGPLRASSSDSVLVAQSLRYGPTVPDDVFMQRQEYRTNRFLTSARRVKLRSVDFRRFVENRSVLVGTASFDSLQVDVYRNNHLPRPPQEPRPMMPHEAFRSLERSVRIDTIRVTNGDVRYSELAEGTSEPGTISFEQTFATVRNVTTNPRRMSFATPAVVAATTQVAGAGRLETTIRLPLLSPHLAFSYKGRVGPMDARAFNEAFVNLSGIRIEHGQIDSLWFNAKIRRGVANGVLHGIYHNLEVETLEKGTGDRGLKKRITTFILNDLLVESSNSESPLRTGTIDHEVEKGDSFFKFLWHSVRSGLLSLVGM